MNGKHLDYLDMVKGIGIFLVVLGHMEDISGTTRIWISSFHMPLFFIVSGIIMAVKNEHILDFHTLIQKKFRGLIIPYIWFSLSYFVIDIANLFIIKNIDRKTFIVDTISSLTFYGMSVLWFLPALFLALIGFNLMKRKLADTINLILLLVIAVLAYVAKQEVAKYYALYIDSLLITSLINIIYIFLRAAVAMSFVGYAFYIRKWYEQNVEKEQKYLFLDNKAFEILMGIILMAIGFVTAMQNQCVDLHNIILNNMILYYIGSFTGVYGLILICKALPTIKVINYFGKNSIIVMACHVNYYILYAGIKFAWVFQPYITHAKHYIFVATVVITVFVLSTIVIEVIRRWFPFVLGKKSIISRSIQ